MKYKKEVYQSLALITQLGISMIVPIFLCSFLGVFLEKRINFPFTVILFILGALAGFRNVQVLVKSFYKKEKDAEHEKKD